MLRACALACAVLAASSAAAEEGPDSFQVVDVAEGVVAFVSPQTTSGVINGNAVAVIGDDGVLVVDAGQFPATTRRMITELKKRTSQPVRYLVNTHWHADHVLADGEYRAAFPGVTIVSHEQTRRLLLKNEDRVRQLPTQGPGFLAALRGALERGTRRDGTPLTADDRREIENQVRDLAAVLPEMAETRIVPADVTFTETMTVHLGRRVVRLLHLGAGNTAGDVVAFVPDAKVAITGDLVVAPVPFGYGSHPASWSDALTKLLAFEAAVLVPGHGPVMGDPAYVRTLQKLLAALRTQAAAAVTKGLSLEDARKALDLGPLRHEITGGDALRATAFDGFFLDSAFAQAYREAKGDPSEE